MRINYLRINGYGKIVNKDIDLSNNINIIFGKNEAGKSTCLNFINSIFYGASKNKNGKLISDYERYNPWEIENFSGKISYTLDNGKVFEVYRDFKKKNPIIYSNSKDISNEFNIDKSIGIDFLNEQIGIDKEIFENTVITCQNSIELSRSSQNSIVQRISNLASSGDENISLKRMMDKINKEQNELIGTNRTIQKPINIVDNKIIELSKRKDELENIKSSLDKNFYDEVLLKKELESERDKLELLKKYKDELEKNKIDFAEIEVNEKLEQEYNNKIEELSSKIDNDAKKRILRERKSFFKTYISVSVIFIIMIIMFVLRVNIMIPSALGIINFVLIVIALKQNMKFKNNKKSKLKELEELEEKINKEIEILDSSISKIQSNIKEKQDEINLKISIQNNILVKEYSEKLEGNFLETVFAMNEEEILSLISRKEERINELILRLNIKQNEKDIINEKVEELVIIHEQLEKCLEEKKELESLNNSFEIAKECIEKAYEKIRENLNPVFKEELCSIVSEISNGRYNKVSFSDEDGMNVEINDGRYVSIKNLSIGTIDQMYLSLRLSILKVISNENMPIILDEAFAYFDDERLENIFKFINKNYKEKQIIIFTCTNREKRILDKLNLKYNFCEL